MFNDSFPLDEEHLLQLRGLPVCVVMSDGERHFGLLTGCSKGKLVLNGDPDEEFAETVPAAKRRRVPSNRSRKPAKRRNARKPIVRGEPEGTPPEGPEAPAGEWGAFGLGLGPAAALPGPRVVLPLRPVEAVLLL